MQQNLSFVAREVIVTKPQSVFQKTITSDYDNSIEWKKGTLDRLYLKKIDHFIKLNTMIRYYLELSCYYMVLILETTSVSSKTAVATIMVGNACITVVVWWRVWTISWTILRAKTIREYWICCSKATDRAVVWIDTETAITSWILLTQTERYKITQNENVQRQKIITYSYHDHCNYTYIIHMLVMHWSSTNKRQQTKQRCTFSTMNDQNRFYFIIIITLLFHTFGT